MTFKQPPHLAIGGPWKWRSVDLVTLALLGVAFGVAFWGWDIACYPAIEAAFAVFPPGASITVGVWVLPAIVGALVVRRPGAALLCELLAASVEALLGNKWGLNVMLSGALQGLGMEIAVAFLLWRQWRVAIAILGGLLAATLEIAAYEWWVYQTEYSWTQRFISLGFGLISGALVAGLGGWALMKALAATGALDAFPPGRARLAARA